jgi:hypothetical protein
MQTLQKLFKTDNTVSALLLRLTLVGLPPGAQKVSAGSATLPVRWFLREPAHLLFAFLAYGDSPARSRSFGLEHVRVLNRFDDGRRHAMVHSRSVSS